MILICGVSCCGKPQHCTSASCGIAGVILESLVRRGLIAAFKFGSGISYLANLYGKSLCLPSKTHDLLILCESLHKCYLRWLQVSGIVLSSSGKHSFEWVNIAQICCDSAVQHLYFSESSQKSDIRCVSRELGALVLCKDYGLGKKRSFTSVP